MTYAREIKRLIKQIPTDFPCIPGCTDCCTDHTWTPVEWKKVHPKLTADSKRGKCPYASGDGCTCYHDRPVICRLVGNAGDIGTVLPFYNVSLKCPKGIVPNTPLSREQARSIFLDYIAIIRTKKPAGPFAAFAGR